MSFVQWNNPIDIVVTHDNSIVFFTMLPITYLFNISLSTYSVVSLYSCLVLFNSTLSKWFDGFFFYFHGSMALSLIMTTMRCHHEVCQLNWHLISKKTFKKKNNQVAIKTQLKIVYHNDTQHLLIITSVLQNPRFQIHLMRWL